VERLRQLQHFWNWLPAFRVVAETQHLPTASKEFGVTASALSRAIKDLESQLGVELFERRGRRLVLNGRGEELLACLRDAMRLLDDGFARLQGRELSGPVRVAAPGPFAAAFVLPALERIRREHPAVHPAIVTAGPARVNAQLLDGRLDLAVLDDPSSEPSVRIEKLTDLSYGVYCGSAHPLRAAKALAPAELANHPFVTPSEGDDHWPVEWARPVALRVNQLYLGMQVCAEGELLALLPDVAAQRFSGPGTLHRLPIEIPTSVALYLVQRRPLGPSGLVTTVANALHDEVRQA
jgi:DNA-binding transcriptional LysR family regulator